MSEQVKIKCGHCKYRLPNRICGCSKSPRYNQQIGMSEWCDFFEQNPAQRLYSKALAMGVIIAGDETLELEAGAKMLEDLETAIELGLCEDDEAYARFTFGYKLAKRGVRCFQGDIDQPDISRGIQEMEKGVLIDSQGGYETFSNPIKFSSLVFLGTLYAAVCDSICERKGIDPAIAYLEEKLKLFDYLPTPPLIMLGFLGDLYLKKHDATLARQAFERVLRAPDNPVEQEEEAMVRNNARQALQDLNSPDRKNSGCFIATAVYGTPDSQEIEALRYFRDNFLVTMPTGKLFISLYYKFSPSIAELIKGSELAKKLVERILLKPVLWIIQRSINRNDSQT